VLRIRSRSGSYLFDIWVHPLGGLHMSVKRVSRAALVVAILLSGLGFLIASPPPASAAVGKVPAGAATFTGLGGSLQVGSGAVPVNVPTLHPNRPTECNDGVDNEVGSRQSGGFIVPAPDGLIDNGSDPQCTTTGDDDEAMSFTGTGGGFQNTTVCDNQTNFPANPQPRKNWSIPSTVTVLDANTNNVSIVPTAVTVPDNVLLQGTDQLPGLELQILQNVKPIAFNTRPPRGNNGDPCARTFTDGVLNSTTTITSATAAFNSALASDVGQFISGPGIPPNTTVASVTNATTAVMSQAATVSTAGTTVTLGGHGGVNGSTTLGDATFTGNGFSALDLGGLLWSPNVPAGTTITAIISGTQVTMSNVATATGSSQPYTAAARPYDTTCSGGAYVGKSNWFGVSNSDGSGSLDICVYVELNIHETSATIAPNDVVCRTDAFPIHLTTGTDGALTGVPFDTTRQTTTMVATNFTIPITVAAAGAGLGQLVCDGVNSQVGFPSGPANNQLTMVTSTASTPWPPVAAITSPTTINTNEGSVVTLSGDFANSYDPGARTLTETGWSRTGGTAAAPADSGGTTTNKTFVAPDAPAGGNTHIYNYCVTAPLFVNSIGGEEGNTSPQEGCATPVTVNVSNVAPTANAGPDRTVNGGQVFGLTGTSVDPGEADLPGQRGYCWTQTGGTSVGLPACTGSPANNRPSAGGKFTALNVTPANAADTQTFSLTVCDEDGGCSSADTATISVVGTTAGQISGVVRSCSPACATASGIPVNLFQDGVGFIGTTTTGAGGTYSFSGVANSLRATPNGSNEVPPVAVNTTGSATFSVNTATNEICHNASAITGLSGPVTGNHIHVGAAGVNGGIVVNFGSSVTGCVTSTAPTVASILADPAGFYYNIHTAANPGGESRGQLSGVADYRVQFGTGGSFIAEWWNDAKWATEGDAVAVPNAIVNADVYTLGQGKSISGTVSQLSGGAAASTAVRLYDESGFVGNTTTNGVGFYQFTQLQPKSTYKVNYARASGTLAETWSGGAFSAPNATTVDVTSTNQVVNITLNNRTISVNGQGSIAGNVNDGATGIPGIQVRAYDFTTGAWIASVNTDASGNYSFSGANFFTNVNGLAPGTYKLWFWNVNQTGPQANVFWCSAWDGGNIQGGQYQGSGKLVTLPVTVVENATTVDDISLDSADTITCPK